MSEYRFVRRDELYHYGVKGMKWGVRKQRQLVGRQRGSSDQHYSSEQRKARVKKGAKIAAKILAGAALTYAVVKVPNTKAFISGRNYVATHAIKEIPGTKYLHRQAVLADRISTVADYGSKAAAVGMIGGTVYKASKKYKIVSRN